MSRPTRFHVAVGVTDLRASARFYEKFFGCKPQRETADQIDWILTDPPVNFSIFFNPEKKIGPEHIGLDLSAERLALEKKRLDAGDYLLDPDRVRVELFTSDPG